MQLATKIAYIFVFLCVSNTNTNDMQTCSSKNPKPTIKNKILNLTVLTI